jgi:hypothetical protein
MPFPITLQQHDYETLVEFARLGTLDASGNVKTEKARALDAWLKTLEEASGIHRYAVWVQWQEQDAPLPAGTQFPENWPPSMRFYLALTSRPITRSDVDTMLASRARNPTNVLVTKDPGATVGWTQISAFFK